MLLGTSQQSKESEEKEAQSPSAEESSRKWSESLVFLQQAGPEVENQVNTLKYGVKLLRKNIK